jgi:hypothetical protein
MLPVAGVCCCQVAYCQVEPTHRFFWQEVAARVGSRSASECFAKIFDAARSPAASAKLPRAKTVVSLVCAWLKGLLASWPVLERVLVAHYAVHVYSMLPCCALQTAFLQVMCALCRCAATCPVS